ncbi:MAG: hypothetical protein GYB49_07975 [Alphaproteobacteria bacterium]|nr:hypothetical protein [Hyphomonas sp.]MBR9807142.1 hypothetical protein [Alphaproteobacteria bacterium]
MTRLIPIALMMGLCGFAAAETPIVQVITADLPGPVEFEAPEALQNMEEGVVLLDLSIVSDLDPGIKLTDGTWGTLEGCEFGAVEAETVMIKTGSNHMLLEVRMGDPDTHAANLLSCNYRPDLISDDGFGHLTRLKGCFYAHNIAIPTALHWRLNPLPAQACGIGD